MAQFDDPAKVRVKMTRISYPNIFKAKAFGKAKTGDPKFSCSGIIDPETKVGAANIDLLEEAIELVAKEKWPKDWQKVLKKLRKDGRVCLREGDEDAEETDGMMVLTASNVKRPLTLDENGDDVTEADDVIYAGCFGDMIVRIWAQDNDYGQRVNASLEGVKFRKDGDPFSSTSKTDPSDFDDDDEDEKPKSRRRGRDDDDEDEKPKSRRGRGRDDDDEDEKPKRRRGRDDDDEDEKPKSRRGRDADDEDEPPKRRRGRDDDDEDDKPKSRRRGRDADDEDEPPKRRRGRDADDEDEPPKRRRSRDEDEDEPKSRRRSRSRDDDDY